MHDRELGSGMLLVLPLFGGRRTESGTLVRVETRERDCCGTSEGGGLRASRLSLLIVIHGKVCAWQGHERMYIQV